ncbi:uncharacterized protein LOC109538376 isoform X1 [Dendroctonus ponderosae]|uniref:uncharacterized protein LOC109538376 isoform X1 n=1 Tax=Dendroctonus ponderosae TaxID=77166 RepID=UPI0020358894|nr:uncharacterized protein LOC109538376 isoform X1 [Dendroctonus ponderosae]KAH1025193.1 hypothetical protein HUJ05_009967 [Dendroctonus ponderosae]
MSHNHKKQSVSGKTSQYAGVHHAHGTHNAQDAKHFHQHDGAHHPTHQNERSKSEHHSRNKGHLPTRSKSYDASQRHQSESPHSKQSQHSGKEVGKSHGQGLGIIDTNDICVCGPNIYGRFLGPTVDEQILAGLSALFEMCSECPEQNPPSDTDQETPQSTELVLPVESESEESLERISTEPQPLSRASSIKPNVSAMKTPPSKESSLHIPSPKDTELKPPPPKESAVQIPTAIESSLGSMAKEENLRTDSSPKSLVKQESFQTAKSENTIKISEESAVEKSVSDKKSTLSNVESVNAASATESPETRESSIITEPASQTSSSQTETAAIEEKVKSLSNVSKESKEVRECPCQVEEVCKCGPLLVCTLPSAVCVNYTSVESNLSHSEQSPKLSSHSKSLSFSHQPTISSNNHCSEHQIASHDPSDENSLTSQQPNHEFSNDQNHDDHHRAHYPETDPPCTCPTCLPYEAAMRRQHQKHSDHPLPHHVTEEHHQSPYSHYQTPQNHLPDHHVSNQHRLDHPVAQHSALKLHKSRSGHASKSQKKLSSEQRTSRSRSRQCQCPYNTTKPLNDPHLLKSDSSLHRRKSSLSHRDPFHPGRNKNRLNSDECACCKCSDTTETSSNTTDSGCKQIEIKVNATCKGSSTSSSREGSSATKESSTSYTCILGCPRAKSERRSCAAQFEDSDTTKDSSTSCGCLVPCPKKSSIKKRAASCKCSHSATQNLNGMSNKVRICGCGTSTTSVSQKSAEARVDGGDSVNGVIRYAITKITKFSSYTTFEVMKSTKKKPRTLPTKLEGVFVLRNRKCN